MTGIDGINLKDLANYVITPTLTILGLYSKSAEQLLAGTYVVESLMKGEARLHQVGGGPARGIYQMEPATLTDCFNSYLRYRPELLAKVRHLMCVNMDQVQQLDGNLYYATAMARIKYLRASSPLPPVGNAVAMANYHKIWYNSRQGDADVFKNTAVFAHVIQTLGD